MMDTAAHTEALELLEQTLGSATGGLAWADLGFCLMLTGDPEGANTRTHELVAAQLPNG